MSAAWREFDTWTVSFVRQRFFSRR